jgi:hypothetical protein
MRARALARALLAVALAVGAAAQRGPAATAAAAATVAVAGSLGSGAAGPAAGAVPLPTGRRPARLSAPPVRLSFTAAFSGLSESDLAQYNNSEIFLPALLAAVNAAAGGGGPGGAGPAVAVADVSNVGPHGEGWGALHVRLAVTFPPGTRPGARTSRPACVSALD